MYFTTYILYLFILYIYIYIYIYIYMYATLFIQKRVEIIGRRHNSFE